MLAVTVLASVAAGSAAAASSSAPVSTELAVLFSDHGVFTAPDRKSRRIATVSSERPITGQETTLPVIGHWTREGQGQWLRVRIPGRPNGRTGWISAQGTTASSTPWSIIVAISKREVFVYHAGKLDHRFSAIVGKPSTPTPQGRFFVEEGVPLGSKEAGAPFALATSARSNALEHYEGGIGQVALHGIGNLVGKMGTAASHGCVRLARGNILWLRAHIGAGVPITLRSR